MLGTVPLVVLNYVIGDGVEGVRVGLLPEDGDALGVEVSQDRDGRGHWRTSGEGRGGGREKGYV